MWSIRMKQQLDNTMKKMTTLFGASLLALTLISTPINAESIAVPIAQQGNNSVETPKNGINKAKVESQYGAPLQRVSSIGEPPISKWVYQDFTVYFENDLVLHSVRHKG